MTTSTIVAPAGASSSIALVVWATEDDDLAALKVAIDQAVSKARGPAPDEEEIEGWTATTLHLALERMERQSGAVQAAVIRQALSGNGYITRESIRKIGKWPKDRMLRGFTRPVNRIVEAMKESGEIPESAVSLLWASYQDGVQADGFTRQPASSLCSIRSRCGPGPKSNPGPHRFG